MRDKKHFWLDVMVAGVVLAQVVLCIAPRKSSTAPFREADLSKVTPGNSIDVDIPGQSLRIEIPKGESPDSGTFSLIPLRGDPVRGIRREGSLEGLIPGRAVNGGVEVMVTIRGRGAAHRLSTVIFEPNGFNFSPRKMAPVPSTLLESTEGREKIVAYGDRVELQIPVKSMPSFSGTKQPLHPGKIQYSYDTKQWSVVIQ